MYQNKIDTLLTNNKLADSQKTISQFWELYILDALLGNFDRHGGNWGFIKENNEYHLTQTHYEDDTFEYVFKPYYQVIDLLTPETFQGIPGLNLELRKETYLRENKVPTFIYERVPWSIIRV